MVVKRFLYIIYCILVPLVILQVGCGNDESLPSTDSTDAAETADTTEDTDPSDATQDDPADAADSSDDASDPSDASDTTQDDAADAAEDTDPSDATDPADTTTDDPTDATDASDPNNDDEYQVNFSVNMNCSELESFSVVYVAGSFNDWCGDCYPLGDDDGDGIWTASYTFENETALEYKYNVDNWAAQEDLVDDMADGASCAPVTDYFEYANRSVTLSADSAVSTSDVYGTCESCTSEPATTPRLTFQVNMGSTYSGGVTVGNSVDGWNAAGMVQLNDSDNDGIYIGSMELEPGTTIEYKFIQGYDGTGTWEEVPAECGLTTGEFTNRVFTMPDNSAILPVIAFGSCSPDAPGDNGNGNNPADICSTQPGRSPAVNIVGRQIRVGTSALHMKGVAWSPIPVGQGPSNHFASAVEADAQLMQDAGINVVRTYGAILDEAVLDELWSHGIYVVMTIYYGYTETVASTIEKVCAIKHHPAVLSWSVGNEWNYTNLAQDISFFDAIAKVGELIDAIKLNDPTRPTTTVYGGMPPASVMNSLSNVDLWGINHYPGTSFGNFFNDWAALTTKPFYFGEYGADAYNGNTNAVDESSQASILGDLTQEIHDNASVNNSGVCTGGMVFEFNDEWWKYNGGSHWEHDTTASWQNYGYPDPNMHEEWWGIVDVNRVPRQAYNTYRDMVPPQ